MFVGTMYAGEGDYDGCVTAILGQRDVQVQYVSIADLPEKEAHNRLWNDWRTVQHSGFDMFVKVDADTVLAHDSVLLELSKLMRGNPRVTGIQAPLHDYFTDGFINGLNCFSPRVTFRDTADELFCDRHVDVDHDVVIRSDNVPPELRPAGHHCYHANEQQAFHFGLHRALKGQVQTINLVKQAWLRYDDRLRALALFGAAKAPTFLSRGFNYGDEKFQLAFHETLAHFDGLRDELLHGALA